MSPQESLDKLIKGRKQVLMVDAMPGRSTNPQDDKFIQLAEMLKKAIAGLGKVAGKRMHFLDQGHHCKSKQELQSAVDSSNETLSQLTADIEKLAGEM